MAKLYNSRMTANIDGEFVVFLIGMRINQPWKLHKWLPVSQEMPKMLHELYANPDYGLLSHESWIGRTTIMVQYWKSFDHLENYAKNRNGEHLPAWANFNKKIRDNNVVGIWHETYITRKKSYENIYVNMPKFGMAKAGTHLPVGHKQDSAINRINSL